MLRARNPNVQRDFVDTGLHIRRRQLKAEAATVNDDGLMRAATKRQVVRIVKLEEHNCRRRDVKDEPEAKRRCGNNGKPAVDEAAICNSASILPVLSNAWCIDSNRKASSTVEQELVQLDAVVDVSVRHQTFKEATEHSANQQHKLGNDVKDWQTRSNAQIVTFDNDFDRGQVKDVTAMTQYVQDIFIYYKYREVFFRVDDYLARQPDISPNVRAQVVDWLVGLQETFELNHETLYLAVKLFDMFLSRVHGVIQRCKLQLVASAALLIASKFDERAPPLIDDFIYLSEDTFDRCQLLAMERELLRVVNFDLGAPLSYRFLRRYSRVSRMSMEMLTLARYVLETSLMYLEHCRRPESLIAAASLLLALRMKRVGDWNSILERCSSFKKDEVEPLMWELNSMIVRHKLLHKNLDTVFRKYSHKVFFRVAEIKPLEDCRRY